MGEEEGTARGSNGGAKGCISCHGRTGHLSGAQERDMHSTFFKFVARGSCRGQKHRDLKGFTSEILKYVKGKVTSDQTKLCLKQ